MEPPWLVARHRAPGWTRPTGALETLRLTTTVGLWEAADQGQKSFGAGRPPSDAANAVLFDRHEKPDCRSSQDDQGDGQRHQQQIAGLHAVSVPGRTNHVADHARRTYPALH